MAALESASVGGDIKPFAKFLAELEYDSDKVRVTGVAG